MPRFRVPSSKIRFIRNGVDIKDIDATLANPSIREKEVAGIRPIVFIGQLIPRKGLLDLLSAFEGLHEHHQGLELQLIGEGRQRPQLEETCTLMKAGRAVRFLGFREDRLERLSMFELCVMTASLEGMPRCLMATLASAGPGVA